MDRNHVVFPTNICHPDEIVELVKGELATAIQTDMNTDNTDEATTDATSYSYATVSDYTPFSRLCCPNSVSCELLLYDNTCLMTDIGISLAETSQRYICHP
jgi:hypothetical protein